MIYRNKEQLGPILFTIYIVNDLLNLKINDNIPTVLSAFADVTLIGFYFMRKKFGLKWKKSKLRTIIMGDNCYAENSLMLNKEKSVFIFLLPCPLLTHQNYLKLNYIITTVKKDISDRLYLKLIRCNSNCRYLSRVSPAKYSAGIIVYEHLKWKPHFDYLKC